ncbi:MAG: hypothetical protein NT154_10985 [Verrucomicrobia bacterium]|nr:hypothetical protein [Verrucomicrobiota bacterium]
MVWLSLRRNSTLTDGGYRLEGQADDVAVIGAGGADPCLVSNSSLTSIIPRGEQIGFEAMRILAEMMAGQLG